jgi:hypothetical protein
MPARQRRFTGRGVHLRAGRPRPAPRVMARPTRAGWVAHSRGRRRGGPGSGAPGGRYQAVPVGMVLPAEWDGHRGEIHVQALVLAPDRAAITTSFVSTWRAAPRTAGATATPQPSFPPFGSSGVTDDQGRRYRLTLEVGRGRLARVGRAPPLRGAAAGHPVARYAGQPGPEHPHRPDRGVRGPGPPRVPSSPARRRASAGRGGRHDAGRRPARRDKRHAPGQQSGRGG